VPTWRHDVSIEEDLVEEIARHTGYDRIQSGLPPASLAGEYHSSEKLKRALRYALSARGYDEAITLSFVEPTDDFDLIPAFRQNQPATPVAVSNPIIEGASEMRRTLIPGLLKSIQHNINHGSRDVCLFELGRVFVAVERGVLPLEREALALAATGGRAEASRAQTTGELDLFDLKGALESAVDAMNLAPLSFQPAQVKHLRAGQSAAVLTNNIQVGTLGRLNEDVAAQYKFKQAVYVAEVDLSALLESKELPVLYAPLPRFPSIQRDVSLLVDRGLSLDELLATIKQHGASPFAGVQFVGTYEGQGIADDKRSITVRFEYRAADRTLRDDEVETTHWPLVETLKKKFNAEVR
jgi:phenylalanyl-tRNA synthetase beta chain